MIKKTTKDEIRILKTILGMIEAEEIKLQKRLDTIAKLRSLTNDAIADRNDYINGHITTEEFEARDEVRQEFLGEADILFGIPYELQKPDRFWR